MTEFRLPNGLRVILDAVPERRLIDLALFFRGGSVLDPAGESGLAHFVEHALFRGAGTRTGREISREVDARGGFLNAYTDKEALWIVCQMLREETDFALDVMADLVQRPTFPDVELRRERDVILAEAESAEEDGEERVRDLLEAALWPRTAYARPVVGLPEEVRRLTTEAVRSHAWRLIRPELGCLVVSGGFAAEDMEEAVRQRFGPWEGRGLACVPPPSAPGLVARVAQEADLAQVHVGVAVAGVAREDAREPAARVLATLVGGGPSSRLFEHLREDRGLCYHVDASHVPYPDRGIFSLYLATSRDALDQAADALVMELSELAAGRVTDDEVARAKASMYGGFVSAEEQAAARVERWADETLFGRGPLSFAQAWARVASVTADEVRGLARSLFDTHAVRFVAVGPVEQSWRPRRRVAS